MMSADEFDSDLARRKFAEDRAHRDADVSNENMRATAQAAILINGGAATAVLAFLAKDKIDPGILRTAPWSMAGFAFGVLSGTVMMYCAVRSLDCYQIYWRLTAHPEAGRDATMERERGFIWWKRMRNCFYVSMFAFLVSSAVVAGALFFSTPPQQIPNASSLPSAGPGPQPPASVH
jgi:hypothetical protein